MHRTTTTQTPNTDIYKYTASMKFILDGEVTDIDVFNIKTIAIDFDYDSKNMPMTFVTLGLYKSVINKMILNQDRGIILLNIKRCIVSSDMPSLYTDYINDKFIYFITGDIDETMGVEISEDNPNDTNDVDTTTLGLLSIDHVNKNKKPINGVFDGKLSSIMYHVTSHLPILIEPPMKNIMMNELIIPPINSVSKTLQYINSINVFYMTPYRFFIDFDISYLISSSGRSIRSRGENIGSIMIVLHHEEYKPEAKVQGMSVNEDKSMYIMDVDSKDCELADNHISEKSYSKIFATNTSGDKINASLSNRSEKSSIKAKTRSIRVMNDNNDIVENMVSYLDTSAIQLLIQKVDVDSSKFTINKEYIIKADDAYNTDTYNGKYILVRKRELYVREDDNFTMNVMLLFRKVSN